MSNCQINGFWQDFTLGYFRLETDEFTTNKHHFPWPITFGMLLVQQTNTTFLGPLLLVCCRYNKQTPLFLAYYFWYVVGTTNTTFLGLLLLVCCRYNKHHFPWPITFDML